MIVASDKKMQFVDPNWSGDLHKKDLHKKDSLPLIRRVSFGIPLAFR